MILVVEDSGTKYAAMENALADEARVERANRWSEYEALRVQLRAGDGVCFDVVSFPGIDREGIRRAATVSAAEGLRVVMWSGPGDVSPKDVPRGCLCLSAEPNDAKAVEAAAAYLRAGTVTLIPNRLAWGTWEPAPVLADFVALDLLCQGYLAIAGAAPVGGGANEVANALQNAGALGEKCLAEAARPENQAQITDPRAWFAPAREAIERGGRNPGTLWAALSNDTEAVTPIRQLYEALADSTTRPPAEWHRLVADAVAGFRRIADRREL